MGRIENKTVFEDTIDLYKNNKKSCPGIYSRTEAYT